MTKKHFISFANMLAGVRPAYMYGSEDGYTEEFQTWLDIVKSTADICNEHGKNFNRVKFLDACTYYDD